MPKISLTRKQAMIAIGAVVLLVGGWFILTSNTKPNPAANPVALSIWGMDPQENFLPLIGAFHNVAPNVTVTYTKVDSADYQSKLLNALAGGQGPDVFMVGNHDILARRNILAPAAAAQITSATVDSLFPQAVSQDLEIGTAVYALPLYLDTLALAYNKDSFDRAGIANPPQTWSDLIADIPKLRSLTPTNQIIKAAVAIGGSEKTVEHGVDLLNLLMMQNGVDLYGANGGRIAFASAEGEKAFEFYLQFTNAGSSAYTWNDAEPNSLDSFVSGKTAMAFVDYSDTANLLKQNPFLNFGVSAMPQTDLSAAINYPVYRALAVSKQSKAQQQAWNFVVYATTNQALSRTYLAAAGRPAALRSLLSDTASDARLPVFTAQTLTARSWPIPDYEKVRAIFNGAIQSVLSGEMQPTAALKTAESQVASLYQ